MRVILFLASDFDERKPSVYWTRNSTVLIATVSTDYPQTVSIVQCTVVIDHCTVVLRPCPNENSCIPYAYPPLKVQTEKARFL
jgi:hypothetical protein